MSETSVFCTARSRTRTQTILVRLNLAGFLYAEMSVLKTGKHFNQDIPHFPAFMERGASTASINNCGAVSGVFGLLTGIGALDIPGMGSLVGAGPIMNASSSATIQVGTGGIVGRLIWLGISEDDARIYENKLKRGDYLIGVHVRNDDELSRVMTILESESALNISVASQAGVSAH